MIDGIPARTLNEGNARMHIAVAGLSKRFGDRLILNELSLHLTSGETVALIGPSGGGKSTLLRCLNGLNNFDAGEIHVGNHVLRADLDTSLERKRRGLMSPQRKQGGLAWNGRHGNSLEAS